MKEIIPSGVGLDIHKASIAIAITDARRTTPRFVCTINTSRAELCKVLKPKHGRPDSTLLVYEAEPCSFGRVRYLCNEAWKYEVIAPPRLTRISAEKRIKAD